MATPTSSSSSSNLSGDEALARLIADGDLESSENKRYCAENPVVAQPVRDYPGNMQPEPLYYGTWQAPLPPPPRPIYYYEEDPDEILLTIFCLFFWLFFIILLVSLVTYHPTNDDRG